MLFGAIAALVAWGIATLLLKRGSGPTQVAIAAIAGLVGAIALSWIATALIMPGGIPVGGIAGAIIGVVAAVVADKRKAKAS